VNGGGRGRAQGGSGLVTMRGRERVVQASSSWSLLT
jgi:hypothetical protein